MAWPDDEIFALKRELAATRTRVLHLEERLQYLEDFGSPSGHLCAHLRVTVKPEDEVFYERKGCLDCNQWLQPVRCKR